VLNQEQWECSKGQEEPNVEVECEVTNVKVPWLYAVDIRSTAASTEDVVKNDVEGHACKFSVEERVKGCLDSQHERRH
jgi:hypothetical protein